MTTPTYQQELLDEVYALREELEDALSDNVLLKAEVDRLRAQLFAAEARLVGY